MLVEEAARMLQLTPDAGKENILAAYRRELKAVHPDTAGQMTNPSRAIMRLKEARDVLLARIENTQSITIPARRCPLCNGLGYAKRAHAYTKCERCNGEGSVYDAIV